MPQLHLYVSDAIAERIRGRARALGMSVSRYLAEVVVRDADAGWPPGFFDDVVGRWRGAPLQRAPEGEFEPRGDL